MRNRRKVEERAVVKRREDFQAAQLPGPLDRSGAGPFRRRADDLADDFLEAAGGKVEAGAARLVREPFPGRRSLGAKPRLVDPHQRLQRPKMARPGIRLRVAREPFGLQEIGERRGKPPFEEIQLSSPRCGFGIERVGAPRRIEKDPRCRKIESLDSKDSRELWLAGSLGQSPSGEQVAPIARDPPERSIPRGGGLCSEKGVRLESEPVELVGFRREVRLFGLLGRVPEAIRKFFDDAHCSLRDSIVRRFDSKRGAM